MFHVCRGSMSVFMGMCSTDALGPDVRKVICLML